MTGQRVPVVFKVLSGRFGSQPEALAALEGAAKVQGLEVDPAQIDVIGVARNVRLAHYFRPAIVGRLQELRGDDDTIIVLFPSPLTTHRNFPGQGAFRTLGVFAGTAVEPDSRLIE